MADCCSLPNAAELVALIKNEEYFWREDDYTLNNPHVKIVIAAADTIEALLAENAKLKAERDAAVKDLEDFSDSESSCFYCRKFSSVGCTECKWEWRGVQKEGE